MLAPDVSADRAKAPPLRRPVVAAPLALIVLAVVGLGACSSSGSSSAKPPLLAPSTSTLGSSSTTARTPTAVTPTTLPSAGPLAALRAAIDRYEQTTGGLRPGTYQIVRLTIASVDRTYAFFSIGPAPGGQAVQGGHGFVMNNGTAWTILDFGTAMVGCSQDRRVPDAVLKEFALSCSS